MQEIRDGNLTFATELQEFGVEHPRDIDARQHRAKELVAPYVLHVRALVQGSEYEHDDGCRCENQILDCCLEVVLRGVNDPALVVGFGFATHLMVKAEPLFQLAALVRSNSGKALSRAILLSVSHALVTEFEASKPKAERRTVDDFYGSLVDLKNRWDDLPRRDL